MSDEPRPINDGVVIGGRFPASSGGGEWRVSAVHGEEVTAERSSDGAVHRFDRLDAAARIRQRLHDLGPFRDTADHN